MIRMNRRDFIVAAAAFAAGCSRDTGSSGGTMSEIEAAPLGIQLYTVRDLMAEDVAATLEFIAGVGYREVEFAGYFGRASAEIRQLLDASGLAAPSAHLGYEAFVADVSKVVEQAAAMGHEFIVVPSIPGDQRATLDDYSRHAENFNRWSEAANAAGLRFAYHNHDFEFGEIDGEVPYDRLLAETDPERVEMQLDLAWARAGDADALAYFEAWPGRFPLFHLKDFDGEESDIGTGSVDFDTILANANKAGLEHGFVERDHAADVRASVRRNYDSILPLWRQYM